MYSAAMAPHLRALDSRWRNVLAFLLTDQAFAAAIRRFRESGDLRANASYFLGSGVLLWVTWQVPTLVGMLGWRSVIPPSWQLDFVVPLCFIAHPRAAAARPSDAASCSSPQPSRSSLSTRCRCACR